MMSSVPKIFGFPHHLLILIVSVVFQLYFFNYLYISHYFNICFYLFFILTLPVKIKRVLLLLICTLYGIMLDFLLATDGIFTMTTTFIGYIRPSLIRLFFVRDERYSHTIPTSKDMGTISFIIYTFIAVFIAMLFYSVVERLSLASFGEAVLESLLSAVITVPFLFFAQLLLLSGRNNR
ncbi:MAG: hypothetical protein RR550_01790 [Rikenellaceae bacterium]